MLERQRAFYRCYIFSISYGSRMQWEERGGSADLELPLVTYQVILACGLLPLVANVARPAVGLLWLSTCAAGRAFLSSRRSHHTELADGELVLSVAIS